LFFSDLFDQDKVKESHGSEDGASQSVHKLIKEMGGVETIAKGLESDLTVSYFTLSFWTLQLCAERNNGRGAGRSRTPTKNVNDYNLFE
jgi:hypothetical protein